MSCGVGHRRGLDPPLLWLWCRLVATAPILLLAWEPPYAVSVALKDKKTKKKKKKEKRKKEKNLDVRRLWGWVFIIVAMDLLLTFSDFIYSQSSLCLVPECMNFGYTM